MYNIQLSFCLWVSLDDPSSCTGHRDDATSAASSTVAMQAALSRGHWSGAWGDGWMFFDGLWWFGWLPRFSFLLSNDFEQWKQDEGPEPRDWYFTRNLDGLTQGATDFVRGIGTPLSSHSQLTDQLLPGIHVFLILCLDPRLSKNPYQSLGLRGGPDLKWNSNFHGKAELFHPRYFG